MLFPVIGFPIQLPIAEELQFLIVEVVKKKNQPKTQHPTLQLKTVEPRALWGAIRWDPRKSQHRCGTGLVPAETEQRVLVVDLGRERE